MSVSPRRLALTLAGGVLGVLVLVMVLMFSMGDPPPDPSTAPLEVVVNDAEDGRCILNREDVAAGVHEFVVIAEGSGATVELRDQTGQTVFQPEDPPASAVGEQQEGAGVVELVEGRYTVVCQYPGGATDEARLIVTAD